MQYFGFDRPSFGIKTFGFGANFDPITLFADGEQGVWFDPSDLSTLFQDVAGTVPVTKDGDPVALMKDKSGNNNHATQTVSTSRPIYKTDGNLHWLRFDGVDDYLLVQPFAVAMPQPFTYFSSSNRYIISSNATSVISSTSTTDRFIVSESTVDTYVRVGAAAVVRGVLPRSSASKLLYVLVDSANSKVRDKDGIIQTINLGTNSYNNIVIGASDISSGFMNQDLYSTIIVGAAHNFSVNIGNYLSAKAGVTL